MKLKSLVTNRLKLEYKKYKKAEAIKWQLFYHFTLFFQFCAYESDFEQTL